MAFWCSYNIFSMQSLENTRVPSFHPASFYILIWCCISRTAYCSPVEISRNIFKTVKILITVCVKFIKIKLYSPLRFPVLDGLLKYEQKWALALALVMNKQCKAVGLGGEGGTCQGGKHMMALNYSYRLIKPNCMNWSVFVSFHCIPW